jgi:hypothetical protein
VNLKYSFKKEIIDIKEYIAMASVLLANILASDIAWSAHIGGAHGGKHRFELSLAQRRQGELALKLVSCLLHLIYSSSQP